MSDYITKEHKVDGVEYPLVHWTATAAIVNVVGDEGLKELVNKATQPIYKRLIKQAVKEGKTREEIIGMQLSWTPPPPKVKKPRGVGKSGAKRQQLLADIYLEAMKDA